VATPEHRDLTDFRLSPLGKITVLTTVVTSFLTLGGLAPVLPAIKAHFADVPGAGILVRMIMTSTGVAMMIGAPFAGAIANRFGIRRTLVVACAIYAIAGMIGGLLDNLWLMVGTRVVVGLATAVEGTVLVGLLTISTDGEERNTWLGYLQLVGLFGTVIMTPVIGILGSLGWRVPFMLHGVAFVLLAMVMISIPKTLALARTPQATGIKGAFPWILLFSGVLSGVVSAAPQVFLPFHLADLGASNPATISFILVPSTIVGAISAFFYGRVRKRLSIGTTFGAAFLLTGIGAFGAGIADNADKVCAVLALGGIGPGMLSPNLFALASIIGVTHDRMRNIGIVRAGLFAGPFVGQMLLEPVVRVAGAEGALLTIGVLGIVTALFFWFFRFPAWEAGDRNVPSAR
jgi:MFS family permease